MKQDQQESIMSSDIAAFDHFPVPLPRKAYRVAESLRSQQPHPQKADQVYRNTLSVFAVQAFLDSLGIPTDLEGSDSQNLVMVALSDVADLQIPGAGKLECRPVDAEAPTVQIPAIAWEDRIGYVVVELDPSAHTAQLLGFLESVSREAVPLVYLQPLSCLLDRLETLLTPATTVPARVRLSQWFQQTFDQGWQDLASLLQNNQPQLAMVRGNPARAGQIWGGKIISLETSDQPLSNAIQETLKGTATHHIDGDRGLLFGDIAAHLRLLIGLRKTQSTGLDVSVEIDPLETESYLPVGLQLSILDQEGIPVMQAEARDTTENIQFQFSGEPGEPFGVRIALGQLSTTENFLL